MNNLITICNNNLSNGLPPIYYKTSDEKVYLYTNLSQFNDNDYDIIKSLSITPEQFIKNQTGGFFTEEAKKQITKDLKAGMTPFEIKNNAYARKFPEDKWSDSMSTSIYELVTRYFLPLMLLPTKKIASSDSVQNVLAKIKNGLDKDTFMFKLDFDKNKEILAKIFNELIPSKPSGDNEYSATYMMQALGMRVFCININCYRYAIGNGPTTSKQRQECTTCKSRKTDNDIINGYRFTLTDIDKDNPKRTIIIDKLPIYFVCPRYCVNNFYQYRSDKEKKDILNAIEEFKVNSPYTEFDETWFSIITGISVKLQEREHPIDVITKEKIATYLYNPTGIYEGQDFYCPIDYKKYESCPSGIFDVDHINGNHFDNTYMNVQTLCKICHEIKGLIAGDKSTGKSKKKEKDEGLAGKITSEISKYLDDAAFNDFIIKKTKEYFSFCKEHKLDNDRELESLKIKMPKVDKIVVFEISTPMRKQFLRQLYDNGLDIYENGIGRKYIKLKEINDLKAGPMKILYDENSLIYPQFVPQPPILQPADD